MRWIKIIDKYLLVIIIIYHINLTYAQPPPRRPKCLTGYMTDVQTWVDEYGRLRVGSNVMKNWIDLSSQPYPVTELQHRMATFRSPGGRVKYLSMARCGLTRIPPVFNMRDSENRSLADTVEYMSFYGNSFITASQPGDQYSSRINDTGLAKATVFEGIRAQETPSLWSAGFQDFTFRHLKELDLRACSIQVLSARQFRGMANLEAIYMGENEIHTIDRDAFDGLPRLAHLDLSRIQGYDSKGSMQNLQADVVFKPLTRLVTLDLSHTKLTQRNLVMLRDLSKSLRSLSICNTGLTSLPSGVFNKTSLQILDLSQNNGILSQNGALRGLENILQVLYCREVGLQNFDVFRNFKKMEILQLANNEISVIRDDVVASLENLTILDLEMNRITTWFQPTYSLAANLKLLNLKGNNINLILEQMLQDLVKLSYVGLSENFIVCNCFAKDFFKMASMNELKENMTLIDESKHELYHTGFTDYNYIIRQRIAVEYQCSYPRQCEGIVDSGTFRLFDYYPGSYTCLMVPDSKAVVFSEVDGCEKVPRDLDFDEELASGKRTILALLAIPCLLLPLAVIFIFRRNLRYCIITMRNSAMIGLINKNNYNDETIFNYDVFVSYCNEDQGWVLDHLLPHLEAECSISVCLHERDFQVGLSILENIVSCMDRSRSNMLVISQRFLLSQWCQFEMHLAQHRLLETRREDLTLVLLEDIPRRLRPNTLHYLMLTKTYIVWPKDEAERPLFWRRLQKSLLTNKIKHTENVSVV